MNTKTCSACGNELDLTQFHRDKYTPDGLTYACRQCRIASRKESYRRNPEKQREASRQWHQLNREENNEYSREYHQKNAERINRNKREYLYKLKVDVMRAYGSCCYMYGKDSISCGGYRLETLTIDHIDQNASERRRYDPQHPNRGNIYSWLRSRGYPSGFRVACMNHNRLAWLDSLELKPKSAKRSSRNERLRNQTLKKQIMGMLGGGCAFCGETDLRVLTFHHVNGDGRKHRAEYGNHSLALFRELVKTPIEQWRYEMECRCYNCNVAEHWHRGKS